MFRKVVTLLLVSTLTFGLAACGASTEGSDDTSSKDDSTSSADLSQTQTTSINTSSDSTSLDNNFSGKQSLTTTPNTSSTTSSNKNDLWRKMVALTFDDSPYDDTGRLLDLLKEKNVKATFFMIGKRMEEHPEIVKRAIDEGHVIGYHTYNHDLISGSSQKKVSEDFDKAQEIMGKIDPDYRITLFRGVGGAATDIMKQEAAKRDWRIINWSNYGFNDDKASIPPEERMQGVYETANGKTIRNGEVFLIHPYKGITETVEGIGLLIDKLKADGYEPVTVTELLERKNGGKPGEVYSKIYQ